VCLWLDVCYGLVLVVVGEFGFFCVGVVFVCVVYGCWSGYWDVVLFVVVVVCGCWFFG